MKTKFFNWGGPIALAMTLSGVMLANTAVAQGGQPDQMETRGRGIGDPMQGPPPRQMMPPPAPAVLSDGPHLFLVQGMQVFKLLKSDLSIVAQGQLMGPARRAAALEPASTRSSNAPSRAIGLGVVQNHGPADPPPPDRGGMMGAPPFVLVADDTYLYIFAGMHVWKLSKHDLSIVAQSELGAPARQMADQIAPARGH